MPVVTAPTAVVAAPVRTPESEPTADFAALLEAVTAAVPVPAEGVPTAAPTVDQPELQTEPPLLALAAPLGVLPAPPLHLAPAGAAPTVPVAAAPEVPAALPAQAAPPPQVVPDTPPPPGDFPSTPVLGKSPQVTGGTEAAPLLQDAQARRPDPEGTLLPTALPAADLTPTPPAVDGTAPTPPAAPPAAPVQPAAAPTAAPTAPALPPPPPAAQVALALAPVLAGPDGSYSMSLELYPEELGSVSVEVSVRGGAISLALQATGEEALLALRTALPELTAQLESTGLTATDVSVGERDGRQRPDDPHGRTGTRPGDGGTALPADEPPTVSPGSTSSLDVRI